MGIIPDDSGPAGLRFCPGAAITRAPKRIFPIFSPFGVPVPSLSPSLLPFSALLRTAAGDLLQMDAPMWLTRAPGSVDLIGGPAETPGSVSVSMAVGRSTYCAIQNREDREIHIRVLRSAAKGGTVQWSGEISQIYTKKGPPRSLAVLREMFEEDEAPWMMEMMAVMIGLRRTHQLNTPKQGFSLVIWERMPDSAGFGSTESFAVASSLAFKASTGLDKKRVDGIRVTRAVIYGYREVLGKELGLTPVLTSAVAKQGCLLSIEHGLDPIMQWSLLPEHVVVGVLDAGSLEPVAPSLARHAIAGSRMGLEHLNKALKKAKLNLRGGWGQVTPAEFEGGLRNHVPTKETGAEWSSTYKNPLDDTLPPLVDADVSYRERALSEHHVREAGRARRFIQQLQDFARTKSEDFLAEAGRGLNSSHRSLEEKCSLRSEMVSALRKELTSAGRKAGLFGSRLAEAGRGSAVVVLGHATAMPRLREIGAAHAEEYGGGQVLTEASQGGVLDGWWEGVLDAKDKEEDASGEADAKA